VTLPIYAASFFRAAASSPRARRYSLGNTFTKRAAEILEKWGQYRAKFIKVFPKEYRRALAELAQKKVAA